MPLSLNDHPNSNERIVWRFFWQEQNQPWRTEPEIDELRQKELAAHRAIKPDIVRGVYPFKGMKLTRADLEWLLAMHEDRYGSVHPSDADYWESRGLDLRGADLRDVDLNRLPLRGICGGLSWQMWNYATTEQREAAAIDLEGADLSFAHLEGAILRGAHLEKAVLYGAHLEGAYLYAAHLDGAVLNQAFFDGATQLGKVILGNREYGMASLADIHWGGVNLTVVDWDQVKELGDERIALWRKDQNGVTTDEERQLVQCRRAMRANRQLADALQAQGLNEEAARFAYRAKRLRQRLSLLYVSQAHLQLSKRLHTFASYLFSLFLDLLAGYGYKPMRSLFWYLITIIGFTLLYITFGHMLLLEAFVLSLTSFHGRGFFPGSNISLGDPQVVLAAFEAVIGLFIEISFIATFTQRFFGK